MASPHISAPFSLPTQSELASLSITSFGYPLPAHQLPVYHQLVCSPLQDILLLYAQTALDIRGTTRTESLQKSQDFGHQPPHAYNSVGAGTTRRLASLDKTQDSQHPTHTYGIGAGSTRIESLENTQESHRPTDTYDAQPPRAFKPASAVYNPLGAWTLQCQLTNDTTDASSFRPLQGKRVVIKDNIPIRSLPMYCGTSFSFTPHTDSPLITRCLAAGATIVGKAQCDYMCCASGSHTASAGLVRNPLAVEYSAGGSSSGCSVLVATEEADLAIGSDQGGSCRIPAAFTGVVGCKPTYGLVPYTYNDGMCVAIDHAGPITRTVEDNALMLGVLAGWDGVDERANIYARQREKNDYVSDMKKGIQGMRIGVVNEGFVPDHIQEDVVAATRDTAKLLERLGAVVEAASVPLHTVGTVVWMMYVMGKIVETIFHSESALVGVDEQGKECNRGAFLREQLLANAASWSVTFRAAVLAGEWLRLHCPEVAEAGSVYKQRLIASYESALSQYDVLLMPTLPMKAMKLPPHLSTAVDYESASPELIALHGNLMGVPVSNLMPTNLTGHPAVSVPVAKGIDASDGGGFVALPIGVMIVGKYFDESSLYRVGYALERERDWKSVLYKGHKRLEPASLITSEF